MTDNEHMRLEEAIKILELNVICCPPKATDFKEAVTVVTGEINRQKAEIEFYTERANKYEAAVAVLLEQTQKQKAEIERLQHEILSCNTKIKVLQEVKEQLEKDVFNAEMNCDSITYEYELLKQEKTAVKSEAIKEFWSKFSREITDEIITNKMIREDDFTNFCNGKIRALEHIESFGDNLVKEMTDNTFTKIEHNSLCETETYKKGG